mgnify:CR=1 FL=1
MEFSRYIEHTLLKPCTYEELKRHCQDAMHYNFYGVCVFPSQVKSAKELLRGSGVKVVTVTGFPTGEQSAETKAFETRQAVADGADEIDTVLSLSNAKRGNWAEAERELALVVGAAGNKPVKVILETCLLTEEQIVLACQAAMHAGAKFVKTSTGFSKGGATAEAVRLMRQTVGTALGVKASGGIRSYAEAQRMIEAGANRLGVSCGKEIYEEYLKTLTK